MGTIIYENKNRIVDLANEDERTEERIGIMCAVAVIAMAIVGLLIKTTVFSQISLNGQLMIIGGCILMTIGLLYAVRPGKKENDIRLLMITGMIMVVPMLFTCGL